MKRWLVGAVLMVVLVAGFALSSEAVGNCAIYRSWSTGDTLTAGDLTTSMTTIGVTNQTLQCLDDYSSDATQMGSTVDPYPASAVSLATTAAGELERLRYVQKSLCTWTQWYTHAEDCNLGARKLTIALGTQTTDKQALSTTATWNAGGVTFTHWKMNLTDTASAAASKLLDAQVGGVSKFTVRKDGSIATYAGAAPSDGQILIGDAAAGVWEAATLTAGTGVTITNAAGAITVASSIPAGMILMIDATLGSCPAGFAEVTAARGRHIVGMPNGGTMAGTVGSAMTDLQNLSVTPTFAGAALAAHNHGTSMFETGGSVFSGGNIFGTYGTGGTFTYGIAVGGGAGAAVSAATSSDTAGTPAGTVSAVTGGALAPYIQFMLCKKS